MTMTMTMTMTTTPTTTTTTMMIINKFNQGKPVSKAVIKGCPGQLRQNKNNINSPKLIHYIMPSKRYIQ